MMKILINHFNIEKMFIPPLSFFLSLVSLGSYEKNVKLYQYSKETLNQRINLLRFSVTFFQCYKKKCNTIILSMTVTFLYSSYYLLLHFECNTYTNNLQMVIIKILNFYTFTVFSALSMTQTTFK